MNDPASSPPTSPASPATLATAAPSPMVLRLGYAGLVPFVLGAWLVWLVRLEAHPYVTLGLAAYAAVVVAMLGGVHWGVAFHEPVPDGRLLAWGTASIALAWVGVMMPPSAGLVVLGVMLAAGYAVDRRLYVQHGLQRWLTLRFRFSAAAALSCFIAAGGT